MKCPKCPGKLQQKTIEGVQIDSCYVCEGIWFDHGELKKVLRNDSFGGDFTKLINLDNSQYDGEEIKELKKQVDTMNGKCPCCADVLLVRQLYKPNPAVNVDACPHCKGIWLDGGEIQRLRKHLWRDLRECGYYVKDILLKFFP